MIASLLRPSPARVAIASTGSVPGTGEADVTVSFSRPFPSGATVAVSASVVVDEAGASLEVRRVRSVSPTGCVVNVVNNALISKTGTVHVVAMTA